MKPAMPLNERLRLRALRRVRILDTGREQSYDDATLMAAELCEAPMAAISLVDRRRQWFKSFLGFDRRETARDHSFCAHAILAPDQVMVVEDAARDERFADNPLVTHSPLIRFYAGAPLVTAEGYALGALCVMDRVPRSLRKEQEGALWSLARHVVSRIERRLAPRGTTDPASPTAITPPGEVTLDHLSILLGRLDIGVFATTGFLGRIVECNQAFIELLDAGSVADLVRTRIRDLFMTPQEYDDMIQGLLREHRTMTHRFQWKTRRGRRVDVSFAAAAERIGRRVHILGAVQDITNAMQVERDRERLFTLARDMLCVVGGDGYFKRFNPAFEQALGYSRGELLAQPCLGLVHPEDVSATVANAMKLVGGCGMVEFQNRIRRKDGEYRHISWRATALPDEGSCHAVARDITESVRAQGVARTMLAHQIELDLASEIQQRLLPSRPPDVAGFEFAGFVHQVHAAGGDYYDYIPGREGTVFLVVADVSGHGLATSLVMAEVRTCLWATIPFCTKLAEVMERTNALLCETVPDGYFVTMALIELNPMTGSIRAANCAHPTSFILAPTGEVVTNLESSGLPMGCFSDCRVRCSESMAFPPGGTLVCMTDGILEARSPWGEFFGVDRVLDIVRLHHHRTAAATIEGLQSALRAFCSGALGQDDITVLVARNNAVGSIPVVQ